MTALHHRHRSDQHKLTYYVSGPMRGIPRYNFPLFDSCAAWLRSEGYAAINPADHDRSLNPDLETNPLFVTGDADLCLEGVLGYHDLLGWDLREIASPHCHGIVMLPGWETSTGATHERYVAEACGKQVWLAHYGPMGDWYMTLSEDRLLSSFTADGLRKALSPTIHDPNHAMDREKLKVQGWREREPDTFVKDVEAIRSTFRPAPGEWRVKTTLQPTPTPVMGSAGQTYKMIDPYAAGRERAEAYKAKEAAQIGQFQTKDSGERVAFDSGMVRDTQEGKPRFDLIPLMPLQRLAELYARGAVKYGDFNWQKANSADELQRFKASAWRHFVQFMQGDRDEDHGIAVVWNIFAALWLEEQLSPVPSVMEND